MKIYIYKEFNDDRACGEEFIKLFTNKEEARALLKEHVRRDYGDDPCVLMQDPEFADDCLEDDYVSIQNDGGDTDVYIIEEHEFNPTRIEVPVHDDVKIVSEISYDPDMKEIYIGVEKGIVWQQDLALVRVPYHINGDRCVLDPGTYEVLVWGNEGDEDYTDRFKVAEWIDPDAPEEVPKQKYRVPVAWSMYGYVEVEASSPEEAVEWAEDNKNSLTLPDDGSYLEDSFEVDNEGVVKDENGKPV